LDFGFWTVGFPLPALRSATLGLESGSLRNSGPNDNLPSAGPSPPYQSKIQNPKPKILTDSLIWVIVVGALAFRIAYNLALHSNGHPPSSFVIDEREYFGAAHVLAEGRGFSFFDTALWLRPPLYVLFLAPLVSLSNLNTLPVLLAQSLLGALTLLPLAWLAERAGGARAARIAATLGALYLPFTLFAGLVLSETLFVFLLAVVLVLLVRSREALDSPRRWAALVWPVSAGIALGLATLTRATALGFVPLAALWVAFGGGTRTVRDRLPAAGALLAACLVVLLPWVVRNACAYGQFVPVDTTSGYNLWLGSVGVRDEERLQAELRPLRDPVERQQFAYERAWENIRSDPLGFAGKGLKESLDLWRPLFSAEERQVSGYTLGRVPGWHLYSLFLLDDLLYIVILALAIFGLFFGPPHRLKSLTLLWIALWMVMAFIFFAVTRFRLPVVAALLPWAGAGAVRLWPLRSVPYRIARLPSTATAASAVVLLAALGLVLPPIAGSLGQVQLGAERWAQQEPFREGEWLLMRGDSASAAGKYGQANGDIPDTRYGLACALLQDGKMEDALALLQENEPGDRFEPFVVRGEAARLAGDLKQATSLFNERAVRSAGERAVEWAWGHLNPPVVDTLEVGSGVDLGYIRGFHGPETDGSGQSYRWTTGSATIRNVAAVAGSPSIEVTWSGWRPDSAPAARMDLIAKPPGDVPAIVKAVTLPNSLDWSSYMAPDPGSVQDAGYVPGTTLLRVDAFVPGGSDPRLLGIRLARISAHK
jgi:4-amino-4-deoxy-L-arabinose transferase-like glycosyltransferase